MAKRSSKAKRSKGSAKAAEKRAESFLNRAKGDPGAKTPTWPAPAMPGGFAYVIAVAWSQDDGCYVGRVPALDVTARGETPADAAGAAHEEGEAQVESLTKRGKKLPKPDLAPARKKGAKKTKR